MLTGIANNIFCMIAPNTIIVYFSNLLAVKYVNLGL